MAEELGGAAVSGIASKVVELLFDPIREEISYVCKYQSNVKELKNVGERVEQAVKHADRQGDDIFSDVQEWLTKFDEWTKRVGNAVVEDEGEDEANKKRCTFKDLCSKMMTRYRLSKEAAKAAREGNIILQRQNVGHRPDPETMERFSVRGYVHFPSRNPVFQKMMESLRDSNVNMIGLYGMGGVGKTTLVKVVARQVVKEDLFDVVVDAEVTHTPDWKEICGRIADQLGLEIVRPDSLVEKANQLRQALKKKKRVLVILDDIWTQINLDDIGIPFWDGEKQSVDNQGRWTLLLASRDQHVLRINMSNPRIFSISTLADGEAKSLFEKIVGDSAKESDCRAIGVEIVGKCGGLPIAVSTIANALKGQSTHVWKDAINWLRKSNPRKIKGMDADLSSIELSYKVLEPEAQFLFQLCGLLNDGSRLPIDDLIRYVFALDNLFTGIDTLEVARNRVYTLMDHLKGPCLLLNGDTEDHVKMHQIIHALAVLIASDKLLFNIQNVADVKEEVEKAARKNPTAISIPFRDISELPDSLQCTRLKLFLLFTEDSSLQIPNQFFDGMTELLVLHLTGIHFPSLPLSLGSLINLRTLSFDCCHLEDVARVGDLAKLEILSFRNSHIEQLPEQIGNLTRLKLLDLSNCSKLKVIEPEVMSRLSRLNELYMGNSFTRKVEGQSNASVVELKQLSSLTILDMHIPDAQLLLEDLISVDLERYRIFIGDVWNWSGKYECSRTLKLKLDNSIYLGYGIKKLLKTTEDLYLDNLNGIQNIVQELDNGEGFPRLKHLHVQNDPKILCIANSEGRVCGSQVQLTEDNQSFTNLRIINIEQCHRLKHLFPSFMAKNLLQLEELEVTDCKILRMIVGEETNNHDHENGSMRVLNFNHLHSLALRRLPQLTSSGFYLETPTTGGSEEITAEDDPQNLLAFFNKKVVFPGLKKLEMVSINIERIWPNQFPATSYSGQQLTELTVDKCGCLKFLFSSSMVNSLKQLQRLEISQCASMQGIIDTGLGREENLIEMVFPKLVYLSLSHLPQLSRFGIGNLVELPSLRQLSINFCPELKRFIYAHAVEMSSGGNYHGDTQALFDEKVMLPSLEELSIALMRNLRKIWHHQLASGSFSKLKVLHVEYCDELLNIFPSSMMRSLKKLEHLSVIECASLKQITEKADHRKAFSQSISLKLVKLPKLENSDLGAHP
ncbi:hypothetical protein CUMW_253660 [Citrus unshiu]|uniref:AAA+ ATPase domain-containing protein n=1 Tax=Citrus unshiu TaxID=55188 RepID=A0A2H5QR59_CITUN|nr:hypothetical protein CUMW_253660 [Citrus unshiu]